MWERRGREATRASLPYCFLPTPLVGARYDFQAYQG